MVIEELKNCKDKYDLVKFAETIPKNNYNRNLINQIKAAPTVEKAMEIVWHAALQEEGKYYLGKEVSGRWGKIGYKATGHLICKDK